MINNLASGMLALMVAKFMMNDIPHAAGISHNPGNLGGPSSHSNPTGDMTLDIIRRAGLKEYEYQWFPPSEKEGKPRRGPVYKRTRNIGVYSIVMTRTKSSCTVKLYENLEGGRSKLKATWTGLEKFECDRKFEEVVDTVIQVRFEEKMRVRGFKA